MEDAIDPARQFPLSTPYLRAKKVDFSSFSLYNTERVSSDARRMACVIVVSASTTMNPSPPTPSVQEQVFMSLRKVASIMTLRMSRRG